ncbi:extracellular solute-binding protein [Pseudoclavibacter terrae]|uniref:extracellular solute-binding protein n=1 Tax=Pseudoclavibacter terrae TaxID=1530195 RepID=UPI00232E0E10|nr:extracellular solute-binding protein [Pseudoclavibacter terrae]
MMPSRPSKSRPRTLARRAVTSLAALSVAALLASCAGGSGSAGSGAGDAVTLWGITSDQEETVDPSVADWNAAHPDAQLEATYFEGEAYKSKIRTAIGAGAGPSVIYNKGGGTLQSYVDADKVLDLSDALGDDLDRFLPFALDPVTFDGAVYAVPMKAVAPVVLYVNEDVMDAAGVESPETWDELLVAVEKLNAAGVAPFALAGAAKWPELMWLEYLADRIGGPEVFDAILAGEADAWSHPAIIQANEMIQDLVEAGGFADGFASVTTDSSADAALLYTGKAAMLLQGTWVNNTFREQAPEFAENSLGYLPFPTVDGGTGDPANIVGNPTSYFSVSADATEAQQAVAIDYLKTGLWDEPFVDRLIEANQVPPLADIDDTIADLPDAAFGETVYQMISDAPNFQMSWDQALEPGQAQEMLTNLDRLFNLQITPEEFSTNMNATL